MKKLIATITLLAVAVLPVATSGTASAAAKKVSVTAIGDYCC